MARRGSRWLPLALALGSCLVLLLVAECGLRALAPVHLVGIQSAFRYDDVLGYRLAPGLHVYKLTDHLEEVKTNELGTVNFQESFEAYDTLVFAVGDSYTQGTGLAADSAYPFQLDLLLNRNEAGDYEPHFAVVNLGLAAFGGKQSLMALREYEGRLGKPSFVLYLGSDNDWDDDVLFDSGYRHRHLVAGNPHWGAWVAPLQWLGELELSKRTRLALAALRKRRLAAAADGSREGSGSERARSVAEREWPVIKQIHELTQAWGATLVVSWANAPSPSYSWLRERARAEGIAFADWEPRVASVQRAIPALPFANPHSGGHWRSWANGLIAESFADAMLADRQEGAGP